MSNIDMSNIPDVPRLELTTKGKALNAKIKKGNGTIPLEITRIVTASGYSADPHNQDDVVDIRQTVAITNRKSSGIRAEVTVLFTNRGNPATNEPPLR